MSLDFEKPIIELEEKLNQEILAKTILFDRATVGIYVREYINTVKIKIIEEETCVA